MAGTQYLKEYGKALRKAVKLTISLSINVGSNFARVSMMMLYLIMRGITTSDKTDTSTRMILLIAKRSFKKFLQSLKLTLTVNQSVESEEVKISPKFKDQIKRTNVQQALKLAQQQQILIIRYATLLKFIMTHVRSRR